MSIRRTPILAAFALATASGALPAQAGIVYAPGNHQYHLLSVINRVQEVQGQKSEFKITNEQRLSVRISAHGRDTLDFAYTLDSSRLTSEPPVQLPDVSKLQGVQVSGSMSPLGKVYVVHSTASADDPDAANLIEGMSKFLVTLPKGAKVGSTWTDTTLNSVKRDGNNLDMRTITTSKILGDTMYAGQRAWRVQRTSVLHLEGNQSQNGQALQVAGDGTGDGMYYVSTSGTYLGSSATQRMSMKITLPGGAETVPVTQVVTSTVELASTK
ncbi:MAG: hypothetical protein IRY91_08110 [Gemmatimonadaceae bacterium]|nr:hypothetical protein [Gemmatimonadaceae bacterium]